MFRSKAFAILAAVCLLTGTVAVEPAQATYPRRVVRAVVRTAVVAPRVVARPIVRPYYGGYYNAYRPDYGGYGYGGYGYGGYRPGVSVQIGGFN